MSMQSRITQALASSPMPNKGNKWGSRARVIVEGVNGNIASVADPTLTYADSPLSLTQGVAMTPASPTAGGGPSFGYAVGLLRLPRGLSVDPKTGVISGTPSVVQVAADSNVVLEGMNDDAIAVVNFTVVAP